MWDKNNHLDSSHCITADAIKEAIPDARHVCVDVQSIRFTRKGLRYCFLTPRNCQEQIIHFDQGERDLIKPFVLRMRAAHIVKAGKGRGQTPTNGELRGSGLSVAKTQLHLQQPGDQQPEEKPKRERITKNGERNLDPDRTDGLAPPMRMPPPKRKRAVARAKVSTAKKGNVPVTLGGKLPPVSVLSRREFGLRALRK